MFVVVVAVVVFVFVFLVFVGKSLFKCAEKGARGAGRCHLGDTVMMC